MNRNLDKPKQIIASLLQQASGGPKFGQGQPDIEYSPLHGGYTASLVGVATVTQRVVVKSDDNDNVVSQAQALQQAASDERLPKDLRDAFPKVLATQQQPSAYMMEHFDHALGYLSLADAAFPSDGRQATSLTELQRPVSRFLDLAFGGYKGSANRRLMPNLWADSVDRITDRLVLAEAADARLSLNQPLWLNDVPLPSLADMLRALDKHRALLGTWSAHFVTWVHGDPNAGNIIFKAEPTGVAVKLIDVKDWGTGDWVFDIAKVAHHLLVTLPIERPRPDAIRPVARFEHRGDAAGIDYRFDVPMDIEVLVQGILERTESFALSMGDTHWRARFDLYMASCLLSVALGRLSDSRRPCISAILMLYAEGLRWLQRVVDRLPAETHSTATASVSIDAL